MNNNTYIFLICLIFLKLFDLNIFCDDYPVNYAGPNAHFIGNKNYEDFLDFYNTWATETMLNRVNSVNEFKFNMNKLQKNMLNDKLFIVTKVKKKIVVAN